MTYLFARRTVLAPYFRTGDFGFLFADPSSRSDRLRRYARSLASALRDSRLPLARALLLGPSGARAWRALLDAPRLLAWDPTLLHHEGVRDATAMIAFETTVHERLRDGGGVLISLPREHPRRQFKTMKAVADAAYGGARGLTVRSWWLW